MEVLILILSEQILIKNKNFIFVANQVHQMPLDAKYQMIISSSQANTWKNSEDFAKFIPRFWEIVIRKSLSLKILG